MNDAEKNRDPATGGRSLELEALKALAHPLRVQIFDALSTFGAATASGLAERLGESSGATSYHLRQLAKHDLVHEVEGRGNARERWWERTLHAVSIEAVDVSDAARHATEIVLGEWGSAREKQLSAFMAEGPTALSKEWMKASTINTANFAATVDELGEFMEHVAAIISDFVDSHRDRTIPGTRPVQVQFSVFPVIGGEEVPHAVTATDTDTTKRR